MHPPMEGWAKNRGCMCHILRVGRGGREVGASGAGGCGGSYAGKKNDLTPGLVTSPLVSLLDNEAIQTICIYSPVFIHQQSSRLRQRTKNGSHPSAGGVHVVKPVVAVVQHAEIMRHLCAACVSRERRAKGSRCAFPSGLGGGSWAEMRGVIRRGNIITIMH